MRVHRSSVWRTLYLAFGIAGLATSAACNGGGGDGGKSPAEGGAAGSDSGGSGGTSASSASNASSSTASSGGTTTSSTTSFDSTSSTSSTNSGGTGGSSSNTSTTGSTTGGPAYPLWLTRIGDPNAQTAHVGLYFTVTDSLQEPVPGLVTDDFIARENGTALDPFESAFRVGNPTGRLVIPTVLLLDLSRSVIEAGALDELKGAAKSIIDSLDPAQELSILTFANQVNERVDFTKDKTALNLAVDSITDADGISTNLYGALQNGYNRWSDGFYNYDSLSEAPQLVAGLLIAVSDGNDTAGVSTLESVVNSRGTKRTIFIRVGADLDRSIADQIANAGVIDAAGGFEELGTAVEQATARVAKLNEAIYVAEYCSPKRANTHELFFTIAGNESHLNVTGEALCAPSGPGPSCDGSDYYCGPNPDNDNYYICCAPEYPFMCASGCYRTQAAAYADCGSTCTECGAGIIDEGSAGQATTAIEIDFNANGFADEQCAALFDDGSSDDTTTTTSTSTTGGSTTGGSQPGFACSQLNEIAYAQCEAEALNTQLVSPETTLSLTNSCDAQNYSDCPAQHEAYLNCLVGESSNDPDAWYCESNAPFDQTLYFESENCWEQYNDLVYCTEQLAP